MALSTNEGAEKLYKLLLGDIPAEKAVVKKPERKRPLPYRHPIIGLSPVEQERQLQIAGITNKPNERENKMSKPIKVCPDCKREMPIYGRGLCGKCYAHLLKAERKPIEGGGGDSMDPHPVVVEQLLQEELQFENILNSCGPEQIVADKSVSKQVKPDESGPDNLVVVVDFTEYRDLYSKLLQRAKDSDRTPELQARNLIRTAFTEK